MITELKARNIAHIDGLESIEYKHILRQLILDNISPELVTLSIEKGREVVYTPPYHSELQLIELLWVFIKSSVALQHSRTTTMSDVRQCFVSEFHKVGV